MDNCKNGLLELLNNLKSFQLVEDNIKKENKNILTTGVLDSQKAHLVSALKYKSNKPMLVITYSEIKAREILEDMVFLDKNTKILLYQFKDIIFYNADVRSIDITKQRLKILNSIINNENYIIILSIESLFDRLSPYEKFKNSVINLKVDTKICMEKLIEKIIFLGYERKDLVEGPGQFAVRGCILDIFISIKDNAMRLEFYDDRINSIRLLDSKSQRSIETLKSIEIFPTRELVYKQKDLDNAIKLIEEELIDTLNYYKKESLTDEGELLRKNISSQLEKLKYKKTFNGVDNFIQYFYKEEITLLDYIRNDTIIFFDEYPKIKQKVDNYYKEFIESVNNRILKGYNLKSQLNMILNYEIILKMFNKFTKVFLSSILNNIYDFKIDTTVEFKVKYTNIFKKKLDLLIEEINKYRLENYKIIILVGNKTRGIKLSKELLDNNISSKFLDNIDNIDSNIIITSKSISRGFEYTDISLVIFSDKELFVDRKKKSGRFKKDMGIKIRSFTDLLIGDYIVHKNHGIGIYEGIETIVTDNINRDYLKISYLDGGTLYVPTDQMNMVQKYISINKEKPKINKLGTSLWLKSKDKAKRSVKILAENLLNLYAIRKEEKGYCYTKDTIWQKEFEDLFPYTETEDQLIAIKDVKKDMESPKVMDRLICGDVGYGKTEVAIRASFKAVQDEKQVAYLVPTTILAQQHYNNFVERMRDFPINIEVLSRFKTQKEQKEIIKNLSIGKVDILIGTHRMLSKDIKFKDLGLVIVDEEQRFGVAHKEKLKEMKKNVDVLTLTATPIPRTLHMSLVGIRDMSVLEEPPKKRYPIQTYVMEYDTEYIKDAINRELSRDGQVYYLYNRIKDIEKVTLKIKDLVPNAKISYIHGKMSENEIEEIMIDFINKEIDILVCTTIIEIGMDISNVNTIIIQDAEKMGLSQLYQLRGRVGRSTKIAYAYLMYKKNKVLDEIEEKRLQTIKDFTEFGSGFKIAMRDLEIRGAGNIFGADQHGHIDNVGYDMYFTLLKEAIEELKGEKKQENIETSIDINIQAYIPKSYIENEEQKLDIYIKIANILNVDDYYNIKDEIEDIYGKIPKETQNLLDISLLKFTASKLGIISIVQKLNTLVIKFVKNNNIDLSKIINVINNNIDKIYLNNKEFSIIYKLDNKVENKDIKILINILEQL